VGGVKAERARRRRQFERWLNWPLLTRSWLWVNHPRFAKLKRLSYWRNREVMNRDDAILSAVRLRWWSVSRKCSMTSQRVSEEAVWRKSGRCLYLLIVLYIGQYKPKVVYSQKAGYYIGLSSDRSRSFCRGPRQTTSACIYAHCMDDIFRSEIGFACLCGKARPYKCLRGCVLFNA
jgi:hypothetical protein